MCETHREARLVTRGGRDLTTLYSYRGFCSGQLLDINILLKFAKCCTQVACKHPWLLKKKKKIRVISPETTPKYIMSFFKCFKFYIKFHSNRKAILPIWQVGVRPGNILHLTKAMFSCHHMWRHFPWDISVNLYFCQDFYP